MADDFVRTALDPARSVVVEACAGSGKTWLLVSRILRILLDGARPGDILAITYTRKAAREIEGRLRKWLRELASMDDAAACDFLIERGLTVAEALAALPRARLLIERVEQASPTMTITTFHGWFGRILGGASLRSGVAGFALAEAGRTLLDEAWGLFARRCARDPDSAAARGLTELFETFGRHNTRALLDAFVARRAEWQVYAGDGDVGGAIARIATDLGATSDDDALAAFFDVPNLDEQLTRYATALARNTATDEGLGVLLTDALALEAQDARFEALVPVFITTSTGTACARKRKSSAAQAGRLGVDGETEFLRDHAELCERVLGCLGAREDVRVLAFNAAALHAGSALLDVFADFKRSRRVMDFDDLEVQVDRLLADEDLAPYLQARLDARYRHVLLDEFQDTNPLQWRILLAWLSAYERDSWRPSIFLVGDPKQSIYRFRRADARIFGHASGWLNSHFDAVHLPNTQTWRNAPAIVEVVNQVFADLPDFVGFSAQQARQTKLPGEVMLLPLVEPPVAAPAAVAEAVEALRDPLHTPKVADEHLARREEARQMVAVLQARVGRTRIETGFGPRPLRWGDVLILTRKRSILPEYERALREAGVPYLSISRGQLLTTLEAADLIALLSFLTTPSDDMALVHTLRAPLFGCADEFLMTLAARDEAHWWLRLQAQAAADETAAAMVARLAEWIGLAARLPVHDLLDAIYHQGDLMAAYRRSVPPAMWHGVCANLDAFLALALALDGGRFPSLPRFVAELKRLGAAGDDEAPDEGTLAESGDGGRLRIMTVHGAKGLEAPLVWLIDANNMHQPADNYQPLLDWPVGADAPAHFSLHASSKLKGRARDAVFDAEAAAQARETLNLLYVAITRAAQIFVASGSAKKSADRSAQVESHYQRLRAALDALGEAGCDRFGGLPEAAETIVEAATGAAEGGVAWRPALPVGVRREATETSAGAAFGVAMHALIEARTSAGVALPAGLDAAVHAAASAILDAPDMRRFFDAGCHVAAYNEVEVMQVDGRLGRIDRLVVFDDAVWVLDYKSGRADAELLGRYRDQLRDYCAAVDGLFGARPVRAMLVFADGTRETV